MRQVNIGGQPEEKKANEIMPRSQVVQQAGGNIVYEDNRAAVNLNCCTFSRQI